MAAAHDAKKIKCKLKEILHEYTMSEAMSAWCEDGYAECGAQLVVFHELIINNNLMKCQSEK